MANMSQRYMLSCQIPTSERYPMGSLGLQYLRIFNSDLQENINLKHEPKGEFFLAA